MSGAPQLVVIGPLNTDLLMRVAALPGPGETVTGGDFEMAGGGKGANQAVAAARAGASVALVGAAGADEFGERLLAELAGEGVGLAGVARLRGIATGLAAGLARGWDLDRAARSATTAAALSSRSRARVAGCRWRARSRRSRRPRMPAG